MFVEENPHRLFLQIPCWSLFLLELSTPIGFDTVETYTSVNLRNSHSFWKHIKVCIWVQKFFQQTLKKQSVISDSTPFQLFWDGFKNRTGRSLHSHLVGFLIYVFYHNLVGFLKNIYEIIICWILCSKHLWKHNLLDFVSKTFMKTWSAGFCVKNIYENIICWILCQEHLWNHNLLYSCQKHLWNHNLLDFLSKTFMKS